MSERTRDEHLEWAKKRALAYLDDGNLQDAFASMASDLGKHEAFATLTDGLNMLGLLYVINRDERGLRRWITGFR